MHLRVDPGATVIAAGATDPFINSFSMGVRHVDIINNSTESFIIDSSLAVDVVSVQGVGNTVIGAGASMTADAVAQNALEVGIGASLFIRQRDSTIATTAGLLNNGLIESTGGDLTVSGPVEYYGQFQVSGGDELRFNDVVTGPGKVFGPGTVNFDGNMAPGTNPALVAFEEDVVFGTNSTLFIEPAGNGGAAGTDFDQLLVSSTTTLGGDLEIDFLGDFMPDPLDSFIILSAATLTGAFDNVVDGGRLDALGGGTFLVNYDGITSAVVLSDFMAGFAGDFEPDGDVDGFGFLKWQRGELTDPLSQSNLAD